MATPATDPTLALALGEVREEIARVRDSSASLDFDYQLVIGRLLLPGDVIVREYVLRWGEGELEASQRREGAPIERDFWIKHESQADWTRLRDCDPLLAVHASHYVTFLLMAARAARKQPVTLEQVQSAIAELRSIEGG